MKKLLLILFISLTTISVVEAQQYTLQNQETGTNVNNGDVITISTNHFTTHLILTNDGTVPIKATLEAVNIINTDGSELGFCFGIHGGGACMFAITQGTVYDSNSANNQYLQPGESTGSADIDFTHNDGTSFTNYPKDYVLKIRILNANDDSLLREVNFTYRYAPNASINTFDKNEIFVSTAHRHTLIVSSKHLAHVSLFNLTGEKVKEVTLKPSQNHIYTGGMAQGIYIVHVQANGKELYKKIIIK